MGANDAEEKDFRNYYLSFLNARWGNMFDKNNDE